MWLLDASIPLGRFPTFLGTELVLCSTLILGLFLACTRLGGAQILGRADALLLLQFRVFLGGSLA
jgi:hypothetical protein